MKKEKEEKVETSENVNNPSSSEGDSNDGVLAKGKIFEMRKKTLYWMISKVCLLDVATYSVKVHYFFFYGKTIFKCDRLHTTARNE